MISKGIITSGRSLFLSLNVIAVIFLATAVHCEVYSSASDMREVFHLEKDLVQILDGYASKLTSKLDRINNYLKVSSL